MAGNRFVPIIIQVSGGNSAAVITQLKSAFGGLDEAAQKTGNGFREAFLQADLFSRGIQQTIQTVQAAAQEYLQFGREIANINTLLDKGANINQFREGLIDLDGNLGQTSELARGMYQAISSGVSAGDSLKFIESSAKAARAGLASTFDVVDAGTTVMAAYKLEAKDAAIVYDKMFETVKRGKVEFPQLAQSIGQVANIAAVAGVSLDEMLAVIATATISGGKPAQVMEGLRSALANIVKPSKEAKEVAASLGIDFSLAGIKAKGFAGWLAEVDQATRGNTEALGTLFGDIQGFVNILSIAGEQSKRFAGNLAGIKTAAGTIEEAFQKQLQAPAAQLELLKNSTERGLLKVFTLLEPVLTGVLKLLNSVPVIAGTTAVAILSLAAAISAYNTALTLTEIKNTFLIKGIRDTIFWMRNFTLAMTDARTAVLALGGWIAVVAVLGAIVYSLATMKTAAEAAAESVKDLTVQQIQNQAEQIGQVRNQLTLAQSLTDLNKEQSKYNDLLAALTPQQRVVVDSLTSQEQKIKALTAAIRENLQARESQVKAEAVGLLASFGAKQQEINQLTKQRGELRREIEKLETNLLSGRRGENVNTVSGVSVYRDYQRELEGVSARLTDLNGTIDKNTIAQAENVARLLQTGSALGMSREQLLSYAQKLGYSKQVTDELSKSLGLLPNDLNRAGNAAQNAAGQVLGLAAALKNLDLAAINTNLTAKVESIAKQAKNTAEAKKMLAEARKQDADLNKAIGEKNRIEGNVKVLNDTISPSPSSGRSRGGGRTLTPLQQATRDAEKLRQQVAALEAGGGKLFEKLFEKETLEDTRRQLEDILKLRKRLATNEGAALPRDERGRQTELELLTREKKVRDEIRQLGQAQLEQTDKIRVAQAALRAPVISAEERTRLKSLLEARAFLEKSPEATSRLDFAKSQIRDEFKYRPQLDALNEADFKADQAVELLRIIRELNKEKAIGRVLDANPREINELPERLVAERDLQREQNATTTTIGRNNAILAVGLIDLDNDVSRARSNAQVQRMREERATVIEIRLL